jgi:hypothetical protein
LGFTFNAAVCFPTVRIQNGKTGNLRKIPPPEFLLCRAISFNLFSNRQKKGLKDFSTALILFSPELLP